MGDIFRTGAGREPDSARLGDASGEFCLGEPVRPPHVLLGVAAAELAVCAAAFALNSRPIHWVGYALGAVAVTLTCLAFRSVDRKRRRSSMYSETRYLNYVVSVTMIAGIALAGIHAYYIAAHKKLA